MSYLEATLKTELVRAFEAAGHVCHKFSDLAKGMKKPHDLVCGIHGRYVGIETKLVKVGTPATAGRWHEGLIVLRNGDVSLNQHTALRKTVERGSLGFVVGGIYDRHDSHRLAFALPYDQFMEQEVWILRECSEHAIPLPWARGQGWDVSALVGWVAP